MGIGLVKFETTTNNTINSSITELTHVIKGPNSPLDFEDGYHHYIHPEALKNVSRVTICGLSNAEIHFLSPLKGSPLFSESFQSESGVLNLIDCHNVVVSGHFEHAGPLYDPKAFSGPLDFWQFTGNAVNVVASTVTFKHSNILSAARMPFAVHSGSNVTIQNSSIEGHYFELFNGASKLQVLDCDIVQESPIPDSHSMLWCSSSHKKAPGLGGLESFHGSTTEFENCRFHMKTGRSLVTGNGSYQDASYVHFRDCEIVERDQNFGIMAYHQNYHSLNIRTHSSFQEYDGELLVVKPTSAGFANFIKYHEEATAPGGPEGLGYAFVDSISASGPLNEV